MTSSPCIKLAVTWGLQVDIFHGWPKGVATTLASPQSRVGPDLAQKAKYNFRLISILTSELRSRFASTGLSETPRVARSANS